MYLENQEFENIEQAEINSISTWCSQNGFVLFGNEKKYKIIRPQEIVETDEQKIKHLRRIRESECFEIINRGKLWYNKLTTEQILELDEWYNKWLDVTETMIVPERPLWLI